MGMSVVAGGDDVQKPSGLRSDREISGNEGEEARSGPWSRMYAKSQRVVLGTAGIIGLLILWQILATTGIVDELFSSNPTAVARSLVSYFATGSGWTDLAATSSEFALGFGISLLIGIPVGIIMGWYRTVDSVFDPLVTFSYNTPRIALAPLCIIWLGVGLSSKVAIVTLSAVLPLIISARAGIAGTDPILVSMSRSFGASNLKILRTVVLPGAIPTISSGVRIAVGQALLGTVLAEFIASTHGLGATIFTSAANFNTDRMFAAVITIALIGLIVSWIFQRVEAYFDRWRTR
jgi:NitT/TauT family transport system permease protein